MKYKKKNYIKENKNNNNKKCGQMIISKNPNNKVPNCLTTDLLKLNCVRSQNYTFDNFAQENGQKRFQKSNKMCKILRRKKLM